MEVKYIKVAIMRFDVETFIKPYHLSNVYVIMGLYIGILFFGTYGIFRNGNPFDVKLASLIVTLIAIILFTIYSRHFFRNSIYLTMTSEKLIGYNHFKKFKGEIKWNEIVEMYITSQSWYITIRAFNGQEIKTSLPMVDSKIITYKDENGNEVIEKTNPSNYEIIINEIIRRAINCEKIDFRPIQKKFPRIITYEKGLDLKNKSNER